MKIAVVSDTHGKTKEFINKVLDMGNIDLIFHLGDYVEDGLEIEKHTGIETKIVKGNGDFFYSGFTEDEVLEIKGRRIFLTHGHKYRVRFGISNLLYRGEELKADIILYGHTHISTILNESGIIIMNPGSPTMPRGFNGKKTFGLMEIGEDVIIKIVELE
ncbi:metallophosphoesterase [Tepidimicrobium xylanilyticum]|uniref:Phosphoesterase n=1 Tax=Tepidimicrobium xylanilyticum TaxID=1123352 RepID=A0A1H3E8A1_9FIRM|nr:metallophosphoesterase [Tepidimicrobium xylanilyticum]GMG95834.1 phosphoesterase [Tepidimicrobium xylanilyticum]SDX74847.1 hypothetical protein SAMN05660923_02856 [Tepidimicrobium xylanilyticum]